ncbi:hypothetical protein [Chrysiogenes arsenatis]|uniref:hypothetical protein n=1 Tax=Chrysiogenes arsenatis TaxID=309797 RepID=UPI000416AB9B|nr:hypothetical protein [Chrysiogenes arsenatis]
MRRNANEEGLAFVSDPNGADEATIQDASTVARFPAFIGKKLNNRSLCPAPAGLFYIFTCRQPCHIL